MKKLNGILACALALSLAVLGGMYLQMQTYKYTPHRWHEGSPEKVIYDVMENYAYPGASVTDVIDRLGEGRKADSALNERLRQLGAWQDGGNTGTPVEVLVYNVRKNGGTETYFAVVYRGDTVVQTALISENR